MLKLLVQDRLCQSRLVGYFHNVIRVFYKHEMQSLADLFGCLFTCMPAYVDLQYEADSLSRILTPDLLNLPPPRLDDLWVSTKPYRVAQSVALASVCLVGVVPWAQALPTGYQSVSGNVQFEQTADTLNVTTGAQKAIASYNTFNVAGHETVNFNLPGRSSAILNRVTSGDPSQIMGRVNSNGQVFIVNPGGVVFGKSAQVNVGGLTASTLQVSDEEFLSGHMTFRHAGGAVVNEGLITTTTGGDVSLIGSVVDNSGTIVAPAGSVHLSVGDAVTMVADDNLAVSVTVDESLIHKMDGYNAAIQNTGTISASGGVIKAEAKLKSKLYDRVVNNEGLMEANSLGGLTGRVEVTATSETQDAVLRNAGTMTASGTGADPNGGQVKLTGNYIIQRGNVLAEGQEAGHGGTIDIRSTQGTLLTLGSMTSAKGAGENSDAGTIYIWSDKTTDFRSGAVIDVSGGSLSGDAGFVEVSGKDTVYFNGQARGYATNGQAGRILIDPTNITISNGGGDTVTGGDAAAAVDESFAEDAAASVTYDPQGGGTFAGFADIWLQATNDITINSDFDTDIATGNAGVSLTLEANNHINVNAVITTHGADLTLLADADSSGAGNLTFAGSGSIASNNGDITLHGASINTNSTAVDAGTANVSLTVTNSGSVSTLGDVTGNAVTFTGTANAWSTGSITATTLSSVNATSGITIGGNLSVSSGALQLNADTDANGFGGLTITGTLSTAVNENITLTAAGLNLGGLALNAGTANVSLTSTSAGNISTLGDVTGNAVTFTGTANAWSTGSITATTLSSVNATSGITIGGNLSVSSGTLQLNADTDVNGFGGLSITGTLSTAVNENITLTAAGLSLSGNALNAGTANVSLTSTNSGNISTLGDVTGNAVTFTGTANVWSTGNITATTLSSMNAVDGITISGNLSVASGVLELNSNTDTNNIGTLTITGSLSTALNQDITLTASRLNLTGKNLDAGLGNVSLTVYDSGSNSVVGDVTGNSVSFLGTPAGWTTGSVTATTLSSINANGGITVGGNLSVASGSLQLNADADANGGGILGITGTLTTAANENITLTAASYSFAAHALNAGTGAISITATSTGTNSTFGNLTADTITVTGSRSLTFNNITSTTSTTINANNNLTINGTMSVAGSSVSLTADADISGAGSVTINSPTINTTTQNVTIQGVSISMATTDINAGTGDISLTATGGSATGILSGDLTADAITLSSYSSTSSASSTVGNITSASTISISGTSSSGLYNTGFTFGNINSGTTLAASTTGNLTVNNLTVGSGAVSLTADSDSSLTGALSITGTVIAPANQNITLTGAGVTLSSGNLNPGSGNVTISSSWGAVTVQDITTTGDVSISAVAGGLAGGDISGTNVTLSTTNGGQSVNYPSTFNDVVATGALSISGFHSGGFDAGYTFNNVSSGTTFGLNVVGNVAANNLTVGSGDTNFSTSYGTFTVSGILSTPLNQNITITSGLINIGTNDLIAGTGNITLTASGSIGSITANNLSGNNITLSSTTSGSLSPTSSLGDLTSTGSISVTSNSAGGGFRHGYTMGNLTSGTTFAASVEGDLTTGNVSVGSGAVSILADSDAWGNGALAILGTLTTPANQNVTLNGSSIRISGGGIAAGTGTVALTTTGNGNILVDNGTTGIGGDILAGAVNITTAGTGTITVNGGYTIDTSGSNGAINLLSYDVTLSGALNAGIGTVTLAPNSTQTISVGAGGTSTYKVSDTEMAAITADTLIIGNLTNQAGLYIESDINLAAAGAGSYNLILRNDYWIFPNGANRTIYNAGVGKTVTIYTDGTGPGAGFGDIGVNLGSYLSVITENAAINITGNGYLNFGTLQTTGILDNQAGANITVTNVYTGVTAVDQVTRTTNAGAGNVSLTGNSSSGYWNLSGDITGATVSITESSTGHIYRAAGTINATTLSLSSAGGNIGTSGSHISTNVTTLNTTTSAAANTYITESDGVTLNTASFATGVFDLTTGSDLIINSLTGTTGNISLTSSGMIDDSDDTAPNINTSGTLTLSSAGAIGSANAQGLDITSGNVSVSTSGGNNITLTHTGTLTAASIATGGGGDITLTGTSIVDNDAVDDSTANITTTGKITLTATAGNIGFTSTDQLDVDAGVGAAALKATASSGSIFLEETSGTIDLDDLTASNVASNDVTLVASGVVLGAGKTITGYQGRIISDNLDLAGNVTTISYFVLGPQTTTRAIEVGLGGTPGVLDITNAELNQISTGSLYVGETGGWISSGTITLGTIDLSGTTNHLVLRTTGTIVDGSVGDASANITLAANKNLTITSLGGTGQVGGAGVDQDIDVSLSGTGYVDITTNNASVYLNSLTDLIIGTLSTGTGDIRITSDGAINDIANDNVVHVTNTGTINLTSNGIIGGITNAFNLVTGAITINTTGGNDTFLISNSGTILIDSINTGGAGDVYLHASFGINDLDDVGDNITTTGDLQLWSDGGTMGNTGGAQGLNVNVGDLRVLTTGGNNLTLTESGALTIESITTGGAGDITLVSNSTIDDIDDVGLNIVTGGTISLTSNGIIGGGTAQGLDMNTGYITVTSSGGNDITLTENGTLFVASILTGGAGDITLTSVNIVDSDGADDDVANMVTTGKIILTATTGYIGTSANELDVDAGVGVEYLKATASAASQGIWIQETSGAIDLDDMTAHAVTGTVSIKASDIVLGATKTITGGTAVTLTTDAIDLQGLIAGGTGTVNVAPLTVSTTMGLGGGVGALNLTNAELNNITSAALIIGNASGTSTGIIDVGIVDLSSKSTAFKLNTTGAVTDGTVGDDSTPNITLANNYLLSIEGDGIWTGVGSGQIGAAGLADLDVVLGGTGLLYIQTTNADVYLSSPSSLVFQHLLAGSGNIVLDAGTTIDDMGNLVDRIVTAGTLTMTSGGAIGSANASGLEVNVGNILISSTGGNNIVITENGAMTIDNIATGGAGNITLITNSTLNDIDDVGSNILTTGTLTLTSTGGLGSTTTLNVDVGDISVTTTGGNAINITDVGAMTIGAILTGGAGNISLAAGGTMDDTDDTAPNISTTGTLTLSSVGAMGGANAQGLNITSGNVTVSTSGGNNITLTHTGTLTVASILTGGAGDIVLTGVNIYDSDGADDNVANIITTGKITLTATTGSIGTGGGSPGMGNELDLDAGVGVSALKATASSGHIYIQETSGTISLDDYTASTSSGFYNLIRASGVVLPAGKTITSYYAWIVTDDLDLSGTVNTNTTNGWFVMTPQTLSRTIEVGLGGTPGVLDITNTELLNINTAGIYIGEPTAAFATSGTINLGTVDLSSLASHLYLRTSGAIVDASVGDVLANVTLSANKNFTIVGTPGVAGAGQVGGSGVDQDIDVSLSGTGYLDITTNNASVYLDTPGNLLFSNLSAGTGNIVLSATGTINDNDDTGNNLVNTGILTMTSGGAIGGANAQGLNISTGTITITSTGGNNITLYEAAAMTIDSIATGGAGNISLTSTSTINDVDDTGDNITTTGTLSLTSTGAIGSSGGAQGLNVNTGNITLTSSGGNNVTLTSSNVLALGNFTTGGAGAVTLSAVNNINLMGTTFTTTGDLVMTSTSGAVNLDQVGTATTISAQDITITSDTVSGVHIQNAGTVVTATGSGVATTTFDDNPGTPANLPVNPGDTLGSAPDAGTIVIDGDFASVGTLQANRSQNNIAINYTLSNLDLTNVTISAAAQAGTITFLNDVSGAGNNGTTTSQASVLGTITITTTGAYSITGTNTNMSAQAITMTSAQNLTLSGNFNNSPLDATATAGTLSLTDSASAFDLGAVSAGSTISLTASAGLISFDSITSTGGGAVSLTSSSTINDTDDVGNNITTTGTLSLTSGGAIGGLSTLNVSVGDITVTSTGGNNISLTDSGALTLNSLATGGAGDVVLVAGGSLNDIDDVGNNIVTTGTLTLTSSGTIGGTSTLNVSVGDISVTSTGGNDISMTDSGVLTLSSILTGGAGNITLVAGGTLNDTDDVGDNISTTGTLSLTSTGAIGGTSALNINTGDVSVTSTGGNGISLTDSGAFTLSSILTGGAGNITLVAGGTLNDTDDVGDNILTTGTLSLTSAGAIGGTSALNINTGDVTITGTGGNNIVLTDSAALTVASVLTGGAGDISLTGTSIADTDAVDDDSSNVTTTGKITLSSTSTSGYIGSSANELDVDAGVGASALKATTNASSIYVQDTSGTVSLDDITGTAVGNEIHLRASGIDLPAGKTIGGGLTFNIYLTADTMSLDGSIVSWPTCTVYLVPLTSSTTIGLGGGVGTLNLTNTELLNISTGYIFVGQDGTGTGNIDVGTVNLSTKSTSLGLFTTGTIADGSAGDASPNITLSTDQYLVFWGNYAGTLGTGSIGTSGLGDLDIQVPTTVTFRGLIFNTNNADVYFDSTGTLNMLQSASGTGNISAISSGGITNGVSLTNTGTVTLTSNGAITLTTGVNIGDVTITSTGGNAITLSDSSALTISSIATGGAGNISLTSSSTINDLGEGASHITTTGTLSLTSTGAIGGGNALGLEVNVGDVSITSTGGNAITLYEYGNTTINSIATGGAGNMSLTSTGSLNDIDDTGNNITTTGTLALSSNGAIGSAGGAQGLNISAGDITIITTGGNNITLREAAAMTIAGIATGGAGNISLTSTSTLNDTSDGASHITTTGTLSLTSTGAIGSTGGALGLEVNVGDISITSTGGNAITLYEYGNTTINSIATGGAGNISLTSTGSLNDIDDTGNNITTTGTLTLASNGAIGSSGGAQGLDISVGNITITSTGGNNITLREAAAMTIISILTGGAGNVTLVSTSSISDLFFDGVGITTTGTLSLTSNGAIGGLFELNVGDITITSSGGNSITLVEYGNMTISSISTGGAGAVSLLASGSINDTDDVGDNIITTGGLSLSASGAIGGSSTLNINTSDVSVLSTSGNDIYLTDSGALTFSSITTGGAGNITLVAGSTINDIDDVGDNIITTGTLTLTSTGAIGGTSTLNVSSGDLTVTSTGGNNIDLTDSGALTLSSILTGGAGNVTLVAGGALNDLDDVGDNIATTGTLTLTSAGAIGGTSTLNINTSDVVVTSSGGNNISLTDSGAFTLSSILTGGAGDVTLVAGGNINDLDDVGDNILTTGTLTLTSTGAIGGTSTLNINTSDVTVTSSGGNNISLTDSGAFTLSSLLTGGAGDVTLVAGGSINDLDDVGDNISTTGTLTLTSAGAIGGTSTLNINTSDVTVTSSGGNTISLTDSGAFTLSSILTGGAGNITLVAGGSLNDLDDVGDNIATTGTLTLTSAGTIGGTSTLNINTSDVTVTSSGGNNISLMDSGAFTLSSILTGGAGDVTLVAGGSINDLDDVGDNISTTGTLTLTSAGAIGGTSTLNINTSDVTVTSSGGNNISLTDSGAFTLSSILTGGAGDVTLVASGSINDLDDVGDNITTTGMLTLTSAGAIGGTSTLNINTSDVTVTSSGGNNISLTDSGALTLSSILTGGAGDVTLVAGGSINDMDDVGDNISTTGTLTLTSAGAIGGTSTLNINTSDVTVTSSGGNSISLTDSGAMTLSSILTGGAGDVTLVAGGSINDLDDVGDNISTTGTLTLTSAGAIGSSGGAQGLNISSGDITITTTGGNNITLRESAAMTIADIATGGAGNISLTSTSTINDTSSASSNITTTGTLSLTSSGMIGATSLDVDTGDITVTSTGGNAIWLYDWGNMTINSVATGGGGSIVLGTAGSLNDIDDTGNNISTTGTLTLMSNGAIGNSGGAQGLNLSTSHISVANTGGNDITLYEAAAMTINSITTGGAGNVSLTSTSSIMAVSLDGTSDITTTGTLNLTGNGVIGAIEINVGDITIGSSGGNSVTLLEYGNMTISSIATGGAGMVTLTSTGSINDTDNVGDNITTTGVLTLSAGGAIGGSSTLNINTSDVLIASTGGNDIHITDSGALTLSSIDTSGAGNITLVAGSTINDIDDVGDNIITTGSLTLTSAGAIGGTSTLNISTGDVTVTSTGGNNISLTDSGALTLSSILTGGAGNIALVAGGSLNDLDDVGDNISTTGTLTLTASGSIGGTSTLNINTSDVTVTSSGGNTISLTDSGALTLSSILTGGAGNITLVAGGSLNDLDDVGDNISTTGTLTLTSAGAIGGTSTLNINTSDVTVTSSGGNTISLTDSGALTLSSILTGGAGNITLVAGGSLNDLDDVGDNISTTGTLTLTATGAIGGTSTLNINTSDVTVMSSGGNTISLTDSGAFTLSSILTGGAGNITLVAGGSLNDLDDVGDNILTTGTLSLTSAGAIGGTSALNINTSDVTVTSSGGNNIRLTDSGALTLSSILTGGAGNITLVAGGSLNDLDDVGDNIATTGTLTLTSAGAGGGTSTLNINTGAVEVTSSGGNSISLTDAGALTLSSILTGGAGNITLVAGGSLNDLDDVGDNISTTGTLTLTSVGAIGGTSTLNINTSDVTVTSSGGNNVSLTDSGAFTLSSILTGGAGNVTLVAGGSLNDLDDVGDNIATTGTLTLTASGAIGGTSTLNINSGDVTVTSSGGNNIRLTDSGALTLSSLLTGGAGDITLVGTSINNAASNVSSDNTAVVNTTGAMTLTATTGDIGASTNDLDINVGTAVNALTVAAVGSIYLQDASGIVSVNSVSAGAGNTIALYFNTGTTLDVGHVITATGGTVRLFTDSLDLTGQITGTTTQLAPYTAATTIGLSGGAGAFNLTNAELLQVTASNLVIGSEGANHTASSGTMQIQAVDLSSKSTSLSLFTTGAIQDASAGSDATSNITMANGQSVAFGSATSGVGQIGSSGLDDVDVLVSGAGYAQAYANNASIYLDSASNLRVRAIQAGSGNISLSSSGTLNDVDDTTTWITNTGTLTLTASGAIGGASAQGLNLNVGTISATTVNGGINLTESADMLLQMVSAGGTGSIVLTSTAGIEDTDDSIVHIAGLGTLTVTSNGDIGSANPQGLDVYTGEVSVPSSGGNSVTITHHGAMQVGTVFADTTGDVSLTTLNNGDMTVNGLVTGNFVSLTSARDLLDGNGAANNMRAYGGGELTAGTHIGSLSDPFEVWVTGGPLNVYVYSNEGLDWSVINGSVESFSVLSGTPGWVTFNAVLMWQYVPSVAFNTTSGPEWAISTAPADDWNYNTVPQYIQIRQLERKTLTETSIQLTKKTVMPHLYGENSLLLQSEMPYYLDGSEEEPVDEEDFLDILTNQQEVPSLKVQSQHLLQGTEPRGDQG